MQVSALTCHLKRNQRFDDIIFLCLHHMKSAFDLREGKRCVVSGVGSIFPVSSKRKRRLIRSRPPGQAPCESFCRPCRNQTPAANAQAVALLTMKPNVGNHAAGRVALMQFSNVTG